MNAGFLIATKIQNLLIFLRIDFSCNSARKTQNIILIAYDICICSQFDLSVYDIIYQRFYKKRG